MGVSPEDRDHFQNNALINKKILLLLFLIPLLISCAQNKNILEQNTPPKGYIEIMYSSLGIWYLDIKNIKVKDGLTFYKYIVDYDEISDESIKSEKWSGMTNCKFNDSKVFTSIFFSRLRYADFSLEFYEKPMAKGIGYKQPIEIKMKKPKKYSYMELFLKFTCLYNDGDTLLTDEEAKNLANYLKNANFNGEIKYGL
jgi:hypothetical protein